MLYLVTQENADSYREELNEAFKLRDKIFIEEKGWLGLENEAGRERNRFDDEHAVHMLYLEGGKVIGYQRMLPTTRPHLLSDVMPELCDGERPVGPQIWEWTRYCVHPAHRERGRMLSPVANALLSGIVEWGLGKCVSAIIIEMILFGCCA